MESFSNYITEESGGKFNIHWQIVRTQAKDIKDPQQKIHHVLKFLHANKNIHNYKRVHNWMVMTALGYPQDKRTHFHSATKHLENTKGQYSSTEDMSNDLSKVSREDIKKVHKDLSNRKYGFQFKSVPKAHTAFVNKLKAHLGD